MLFIFTRHLLISWPRLYLPQTWQVGGARQSLPRILALWTGRTAFIPTHFRSQSKTLRLYLRIYQQCYTTCRRPLRVGTCHWTKLNQLPACMKKPKKSSLRTMSIEMTRIKRICARHQSETPKNRTPPNPLLKFEKKDINHAGYVFSFCKWNYTRQPWQTWPKSSRIWCVFSCHCETFQPSSKPQQLTHCATGSPALAAQNGNDFNKFQWTTLKTHVRSIADCCPTDPWRVMCRPAFVTKCRYEIPPSVFNAASAIVMVQLCYMMLWFNCYTSIFYTAYCAFIFNL